MESPATIPRQGQHRDAMNHANEISAEVIETTFGQQSAYSRFASFCNAVIVAEGIAQSTGIPVLSEKPGADGCLDGEWDVHPLHRSAVAVESTNPFGAAGWNIYQFKARGIAGGGRSKAISGLQSSLKGAASELVARLKQPKAPAQYVLFTNLQLGLKSASKTKSKAVLSKDRSALEKSIVVGASGNVSVQIVDAAQLAALVNKHPALRLTYFSAPVARAWDEKWTVEQSAKNYKVPTQPALIGREIELAEISKWLADEETKVIAISGPSGMGKTRLALESTRQDRFRTTVVDLVDEFERWGLGSFGTSPQPCFMIVEDPDAEQAQRLAKQATSSSGLKLILTFPSEAKTPALKLTEDQAIRSLVLKPLNLQQSEKLLTAAGANFDSKALDWILRQAGGVPEILLSAAELGPRLRDKSGDLQTKLAKAYRKRIEKELGSDAMRAIRLISPLQWAKVTGDKPDLPALLKTIGTNQNRAHVIECLKQLEKLGYVRWRGDHVSAAPPLFAADLVEELVATQMDEVLAAFDQLGDASRKRLLERVITTNIGERSKFWDHVFESAFGSKGDRLLANLDFLDYVGRAVPQRTARFLTSQLDGLQGILRESEYNSARNTLLSTFRALAYEAESCADGMQLLQAAALCNPLEMQSQSATERFCECFVHWYFAFPMSFQDREQWLRRMLDSHDPGKRRLAARAVVTATAPPNHLGGYTVNARKLSAPPPKRLWREVHDYLNHMLELRFDLTQDTDKTIADFAQAKFVRVFHELRAHFPPDLFIAAFEKFVAWQTRQPLQADESEMRNALHRMEEAYVKASKRPDEAEHADKWKTRLEKASKLCQQFDQGPFVVRLKIGLANPFDHDWEEVDGKRVYSFEKRCRVLAKEAVANPLALNEEAWRAVNGSNSHQSHTFLLALGEFDEAYVFLGLLEAAAGDERGDYNFSLYLTGLRRRDQDFVEARLDELKTRPEFAKSALLKALESTGPTEGNRKRLLELIALKAVEPNAVGRMFTYGKWLDDLPATEVRTILEFIATGGGEWAKQIIRVLSLYLHSGKALPTELIPIAERALKELGTVDDSLDWECGQVAIGIGKSDLDKAFAILQLQAGNLKAEGWRRTWTPFHAYRAADFWQFLRGKDPTRAYRELLALGEIGDRNELGLLLDLEHHRESILGIAAESESNGIFFARLVSGTQGGFFPFAYALLKQFPQCERIRSILGATAAYQLSSGEFSFEAEVDKFQQAKSAIEAELKSSDTPANCIGWLEEIMNRLQTEMSKPRFNRGEGYHLGWD